MACQSLKVHVTLAIYRLTLEVGRPCCVVFTNLMGQESFALKHSLCYIKYRRLFFEKYLQIRMFTNGGDWFRRDELRPREAYRGLGLVKHQAITVGNDYEYALAA